MAFRPTQQRVRITLLLIAALMVAHCRVGLACDVVAVDSCGTSAPAKDDCCCPHVSADQTLACCCRASHTTPSQPLAPPHDTTGRVLLWLAPALADFPWSVEPPRQTTIAHSERLCAVSGEPSKQSLYCIWHI